MNYIIKKTDCGFIFFVLNCIHKTNACKLIRSGRKQVFWLDKHLLIRVPNLNCERLRMLICIQLFFVSLKPCSVLCFSTDKAGSVSGDSGHCSNHTNAYDELFKTPSMADLDPLDNNEEETGNKAGVFGLLLCWNNFKIFIYIYKNNLGKRCLKKLLLCTSVLFPTVSLYVLFYKPLTHYGYFRGLVFCLISHL